MLAQSFKSADELGITKPQRDALCKTLVLLETDKLVHVTARAQSSCSDNPQFSGHFNMSLWAAEYDCGTVCCIGGTAQLVGDTDFGQWWAFSDNWGLKNLFAPPQIRCSNWEMITPAQAATALRSYLTIGDAKWHEAVA